MREAGLEVSMDDDRPIQGFASSIEQASNMDDFDLAVRLQAVAQQLGTGIPGDQSVASDLYRNMIKWVRGRRLFEDYGDYEVEVPWLCLHTPPGGTARLKLG